MFCFSLNSLRTTIFSAAVCIISDLSRTFYYSKSVSWCSMCSIVPYVISYNSYITNYCPCPLSAPPPPSFSISLYGKLSPSFYPTIFLILALATTSSTICTSMTIMAKPNCKSKQLLVMQAHWHLLSSFVVLYNNTTEYTTIHCLFENSFDATLPATDVKSVFIPPNRNLASTSLCAWYVCHRNSH